jgi:hypothetical protein
VIRHPWPAAVPRGARLGRGLLGLPNRRPALPPDTVPTEPAPYRGSGPRSDIGGPVPDRHFRSAAKTSECTGRDVAFRLADVVRECFRFRLAASIRASRSTTFAWHLRCGRAGPSLYETIEDRPPSSENRACSVSLALKSMAFTPFVPVHAKLDRALGTALPPRGAFLFFCLVAHRHLSRPPP